VNTFEASGGPRVGLAHGPGTLAFLANHRDLVDYVEIPFEQLRHSPHLSSVCETIPVVLHCASLSVAGFVPPTQETLDAIDRAAKLTSTPWIGEHLAFVSADGLTEAANVDPAPTELTYTVCPQLSEETVAQVVRNITAWRPRFSVPLILENSPQYFEIPGSTLGMVDFIRAVTSRCDVGLLLDLTHFLIMSLNTAVDPVVELERLPLERITEIHLSGMSRQSGIVWDDHAAPAPRQAFDLLEQALRRARPRGVTIEYNWSQHFPESVLMDHLTHVRRTLARA
jgi:uncharacterized protein